eukprot:TRINITY_DN4152_c0_g1_i2.p1 TRINITY_DN4152_c0_g1~~TRINITY_DN4152_c0_g1_i2.p1  ORF type:complete len:367 (+),score=76.51 TRINITY_DN4152_c0_g1_i2:564-1664(+)
MGSQRYLKLGDLLVELGLEEEHTYVSDEESSADSGARVYKKNRLYKDRRKRTRPIFPKDRLLELFSQENPKNYWSRLRSVGKGGYGTVYIGKPKDKELHGSDVRVAIKVFKKISKMSNHSYHNIANEVDLLDECKSDFIVYHIRSFHFKDEIWMVMEYCDAGSLRDFVEYSLDPGSIACIITQIVKGLSLMHSKNLIHRDVKSDNVLLNVDGTVKLGDFGLATKIYSKRSKATLAGSKFWIAPEMLRYEGYDYPVDIWALGCTLVEMMTGQPPYYKSTKTSLDALFLTAYQGRDMDIPFESTANGREWTSEIYDFLDKCLEFVPEDRSSITELLDHPFLLEAETHDELRENIQFRLVLLATENMVF